MKMRFFSVLLLALVFGLASCGGSGEEGETKDGKDPKGEKDEPKKDDTAGMIWLDLNSHGYPMEILIPDTAANSERPLSLDLGYRENGDLGIKVGKSFNIAINIGADIETVKMDLDGNIFEETYIDQSDKVLVYRSEIKGSPTIKPTHHIYVVVNVDGEDYYVKDEGDGPYGLLDAEAMKKAAMSIRPKKMGA